MTRCSTRNRLPRMKQLSGSGSAIAGHPAGENPESQPEIEQDFAFDLQLAGFRIFDRSWAVIMIDCTRPKSDSDDSLLQAADLPNVAP